MPSSQKKSYGPIVHARVCRVLKGILEATKVGEVSDSKKLQFRWQDEAAGRQKVTIETTLQTLIHVTNQDGQATVTTANVREALEAMRDFLGIMQDHRVKTKGEAQWKFTLALWSRDIQRNLNEFDKLWESKRSPRSKPKPTPEVSQRSASEAIPESSIHECPPLKNQQHIAANGHGTQINDAQAPTIVGDKQVIHIHPPERRADTSKKTILMLPASGESFKEPRWRQELATIGNAVNDANPNNANKDERFEVQERPYANSSDLAKELKRHEPYIIHISGRADGVEGLVLESHSQSIDESQKELITRLFELHAKAADCIVLSGCCSEDQIREIVQHIKFAIGITADLEETHAIQFLNAFYYHLASGGEIEDSYHSGCNLIQRHGCSDKSTLPRLFTKNDEAKRRDLERELDACINQLERDSSSIQLWRKKADLLKELGRIDEANDAYEKASSLDPGDPSIRVQQGDALGQLGDHEKAIAAYDKAIELNGDYKIWWKKAREHIKAGEDKEAGDSYKNALSLLPSSPDDYVICREYGNALGKPEHFYESILLYQTSLCLQPNYRVANHDKKQMYKRIYAKKQ